MRLNAALAAGVLLCLTGAGCHHALAEPDPRPVTCPSTRDPSSLRADPAFDAATLPPDAQGWHRQLLTTLQRSHNPTEMAESGDLYAYARPLNDTFVSLLAAFRVTGDPALLDELDRLAELMRAQLSDTNGDGYLNWRWLAVPDSRVHYGQDQHVMDEMMTHAGVAAVAYALDVNRDLKPEYGAHADFWRDYLVHHFEAKWRERREVPEGFPFLEGEFMHPLAHWLRYLHYRALLTGDSRYQDEADHLTDIFFEQELREVTTPAGPGYVWPHSTTYTDGTEIYLQPTTYTRYVVAAVVDLHLERMGRFADEAVVRAFANSVSSFLVGPDDLGRDIGGGVSRAGLPAAPPEFGREEFTLLADGSWTLLATWDKSGALEQAAAHALRESSGPMGPFIAADLLFTYLYDACTATPKE